MDKVWTLSAIGATIGLISFFYGLSQGKLFYMVGGVGLIIIVLSKLARRAWLHYREGS